MRQEIELEIKKTQLGILRERLNVNAIKLLDYYNIDSGSHTDLKQKVNCYHKELVEFDNVIDGLSSKKKARISSLSLLAIIGIVAISLLSPNIYVIIGAIILTTCCLYFLFIPKLESIDKLLESNSIKRISIESLYDENINEYNAALAKFNLLKEKENLIEKIIEIENGK